MSIAEGNAVYVPCIECEGDGCHGPNPREDGCKRCGGSGCEPPRYVMDQIGDAEHGTVRCVLDTAPTICEVVATCGTRRHAEDVALAMNMLHKLREAPDDDPGGNERSGTYGE